MVYFTFNERKKTSQMFVILVSSILRKNSINFICSLINHMNLAHNIKWRIIYEKLIKKYLIFQHRYLMFEPLSDNTEPNLGSLSAFLKREDSFGSIVLTPIWSMYNFQGLTWNYAQAPLRADGDFQVWNLLFKF